MKSHFRFSRKQRNGIFLLIGIIVLIQIISILGSVNQEVIIEEDEVLNSWRQEVDSLAQLNLTKEQLIRPFNPNFITDYKGYILGMSLEEIDALHSYRDGGQWINSIEEFKQVTGVSQKWLDSISPYFKFPDWVENDVPNRSSQSHAKTPKTFIEKIDLNKATAAQLQKVNGIGPALSKRIVSYRDRIEGGFADDIELTEVYGLDEEVIARINEMFTVKSPRVIEKVDINIATTEELVKIPYIDYELAYQIIEFRTLHDGISEIRELTKIEDFPENKIKLIGLYLQF